MEIETFLARTVKRDLYVYPRKFPDTNSRIATAIVKWHAIMVGSDSKTRNHKARCGGTWVLKICQNVGSQARRYFQNGAWQLNCLSNRTFAAELISATQA